MARSSDKMLINNSTEDVYQNKMMMNKQIASSGKKKKLIKNF